MARVIASIDISAMPDLARLADEVARTRTPCVLRRGDEEIAVLSPARPRRRRQTRRGQLVDTSSLPPVPKVTVRELAGFAGKLPQPLTWEEVEAIVEEERAAAWRAKYS
jgi:hypothetical protein